MDDQRSKPTPIAIIAMLLAFPAFTLYVLSVGPSVRLRDHGYLSQRALEMIYFPLMIVVKCFAPFMRVLEWWISFFAK